MKELNLKKLASNEAMIAELEAQNDKLRAKVMAELKAENLDTYTSELGSFYITRRTKWEYSEKVKAIVEDQKMYLGAAKKTEEENGTAKAEQLETLAFRAPKNG